MQHSSGTPSSACTHARMWIRLAYHASVFV
jgi:hypothetical protein